MRVWLTISIHCKIQVWDLLPSRDTGVWTGYHNGAKVLALLEREDVKVIFGKDLPRGEKQCWVYDLRGYSVAMPRSKRS